DCGELFNDINEEETTLRRQNGKKERNAAIFSRFSFFVSSERLMDPRAPPAGTAWSTKRYLNIELLKDQQMRGAITASARAGCRSANRKCERFWTLPAGVESGGQSSIQTNTQDLALGPHLGLQILGRGPKEKAPAQDRGKSVLRPKHNHFGLSGRSYTILAPAQTWKPGARPEISRGPDCKVIARSSEKAGANLGATAAAESARLRGCFHGEPGSC